MITQTGASLSATPVHYDPHNDLALLRIGAALPVLADRPEPQLGDRRRRPRLPRERSLHRRPGALRRNPRSDQRGLLRRRARSTARSAPCAARSAAATPAVRSSTRRVASSGPSSRRPPAAPRGRLRGSRLSGPRSAAGNGPLGEYRPLCELSGPSLTFSKLDFDVGAVSTSDPRPGSPTGVCPHFHAAIELIGKRWTGAIVCALTEQPMRFGELAKAVPGLSDRLLSQRLARARGRGPGRARGRARDAGSRHLLADREGRRAGSRDSRAAPLGAALEALRVASRRVEREAISPARGVRTIRARPPGTLSRSAAMRESSRRRCASGRGCC